MKKTIIALTAVVIMTSLANAGDIRSTVATLSGADHVMTVEAAQMCWQEQMVQLFTDFEPEFRGTPLWVIKADSNPSMNCETPAGRS